ncbi:toll/interleukin-1 receptor domain-containing protein [Paenibacillus sp. FSL R7-0337]|uniref:toll/interleukin-1 receptor domain-containing protein n=1 Tax=Paenibacillus sp. FSL R7-0337 TaxID=1926588 RepID=UPI0015C2CCBF|nr:toll/interleukin-1 receptor domain-containing protein [Paenibacillus sp. FSL R7-0337]
MELNRDYVWECDYGVRRPLIPVLRKLLFEQDASSLQMVSLMVNNIPYYLEFYLIVSYDVPQEGHIKTMIDRLSALGLRYRPDITYDDLFDEIANRRFDLKTISKGDEVESNFNSGIFYFAEKDYLQSQGYVIKPLGNKVPVFLSHSSRDKPEIEDLIPYLNGAGLPVWFDKVSIDYGESITEAIERGIDKSGAVLFWITKEFLNSNWCKTERRNFLSRHSGYNDVLVISIISDDIDIRTEVPTFLRDLKALVRPKNQDISLIAREIIPVLKKYLEVMQ